MFRDAWLYADKIWDAWVYAEKIWDAWVYAGNKVVSSSSW